MSQHDTATATATSDSKAVMTNAIINPIIDTQMSSTRCAAGCTENVVIFFGLLVDIIKYRYNYRHRQIYIMCRYVYI